MKTITLNKDSWHYRLLQKLDFSPSWSEDFCHYLRKCLGALLLLLAVFVAALAYTASMGDVLAWIAAMIVYRTWLIFSEWAVIGIVFSSVALILLTVFVVAYVSQKMPKEKREVIEAAWESFHDKVCFRLKFND